MNNTEIQKIITEEIKNLSANIGKKVIWSKYSNEVESIGILREVNPYKNVLIWDGICTNIEPFVGAFDGITKIVEEQTGKVLYENTTLKYSTKNSFDDTAVLAEMNMLRQAKYGTDKYNAKKIGD